MTAATGIAFGTGVAFGATDFLCQAGRPPSRRQALDVRLEADFSVRAGPSGISVQRRASRFQYSAAALAALAKAWSHGVITLTSFLQHGPRPGECRVNSLSMSDGVG
mmetsp:Transcript_89807/g.254385  ORF Transcript_89807/g.254385 Transcript_89807/m.254385 type:complete len:107 (+) Transcript_89807:670-990(+)